MVGEQIDDGLSVSGIGVDVTKRLVMEEYPVPPITFTIESDRSNRVAVQFVDSVPDEFDVTNLGFHREEGEEN